MQAHLALTKAWAAHGEGISGQGMVIGILDSGVKSDHPAVDGKVVMSLVYDGDLLTDDVDHGTSVAQILAGSAFGEWPGGIAPDADLAAALIFHPSEQVDQQVEVDQLDEIHQDLRNAGAKILNNSWGKSWHGDDRVADAFAEAHRPFIEAGGLVIFAAGDDAAERPNDLAALPSTAAAGGPMESGWITVAAVETENPTRLAEYSNACGIAMRYCLVAPGDVVVTGKDDVAGHPTYKIVQGTSYAAPQVSAAAALVWQKFPYFDGSLVRQTLLGTAADLGDPGVDPVFGWGMLDIEKAMGGPARLDWGDVAVHLPAGSDSVWWNDISGAGGLTIDGSGNVVDGVGDPSLRLMGMHNFEGPLNITGGATVAVNGRLEAPIFIDSNSYLYAWEVEVAGNVLNRGVMQINSAEHIETPTVFEGDIVNEGIFINREHPNTSLLGDFSQSAEGQYWTILGNEPLHIGGHAALDGGLHIYKVADGYVAHHATEVLRADGGISGQFDELTWDPGLLLEATIGYGPDRVWLDVDRVEATAVPGLAYTSSNFAAAQRLEKAFVRLDAQFASPTTREDFAKAAGALQRTSSVQALQRSLDSLSGELHQADQAFALMAIERNRHALESRIDAGVGHGSGAWADAGKALRASPSFDMDSSGWTLGFDHRYGEGLTFGVALARTDGYAWHALRADRERNRQSEGRVYASADAGDYFLLGSAAAGRMQRDLRREILLGADSFRTRSEYAGRYGSFELQAGRHFDANGLRLTPYLGVQALRFRRGGFEETGAAGFGLIGAGAGYDVDQALFGARVAREWAAGPARWTFRGRLEWQRRLTRSSDDFDARFAGLEVWSPIAGATVDRESGVLGLGLEARFGRNSRVSLDVDGRSEFGRESMAAQASWSVAY